MKPRKPRGGAVARKLDKAATIRQQIERERTRHANAMAGFAALRTAAAGIADPARQALALAPLRSKEREEHDRHRDKVAELERRARKVWD